VDAFSGIVSDVLEGSVLVGLTAGLYHGAVKVVCGTINIDKIRY
jgi:hypothetical protein